MLTVLRYDTMLLPLTTCTFATGRSCLVHLIERYGPDRVVMPHMVPEGLIMPFEKAGIRVDFYDLRADLSPHLGSLGRAIGRVHGFAGRPSTKRPLVVVVHYFGYAMPTCDAAIMAHEAGGLLLEDCAHCLVNPDPKNDCADIALYSMNKILPVSDGAMLFSRSPNADVSMPKDLRPSDDVAVNAYFQHMVANRFIALTSSSLYPEAHAQSLNHYEDYYRSISSDMQPRAMSALARAFRNDLDFHGIVKIRRENASKIIKRLRSRYLFRNDVPIFALPVRCGHRLRAADQMAKLGVAAEIVSDRWISPPSGSPARDFWDKHLLLPIHESMTPSDIVKVAVAVWRSA